MKCSTSTPIIWAPQAVTDALGQLAWEDAYQPFGTATNTGAATAVSMDPRFPGQRVSAETGYHYNYFRDYDPSLGRYLQSDPIGLAGGLNTYGYVMSNPLIFMDIFGLEITGEWTGFSASVTSWQYTGLQADLEMGPNGNDLVDRLGYLHFLISGNLDATVKCRDTDECGNLLKEWETEGRAVVENLPFKTPLDEPRYPVPGMKYVIWADKILRAGQFMYEWRGVIETAGKSLLDSPTLICKQRQPVK